MSQINKHGFTIVELLIAIAVIGILAAITTTGYNGIQMRAANTTSKSDGVNAADQIELYFAKTGTFPVNEAALSTYKKDANTGWEYTTVTGYKAYCLEIWNTKAGSKHFTVRDDKNIYEGTCDGWVPSSGTPTPDAPAAPSPTIASLTASSFNVTWASVAGASSYTVKFGTSTPSGVASGCTTTSATSCPISGLAADTNYYVSVTSNNAGGSTESSVVTTLTRMPAPSAPSISFTGPTRVKLASGEYVQRYVITGSGGVCSLGTRQWKMGASPSATFYEPWSWVSTSTNNSDVLENGLYSPTDVTLYARPRCVSNTNPSNSTEGSTASTTYGNGGGGPGGTI